MKIIDITELDSENYIVVIARLSGLFKKKLVLNQIFRRGANSYFDAVTYRDIDDKKLKVVVENYIFMRKKLNASFQKRAAGQDIMQAYAKSMFNKLQGMAPSQPLTSRMNNSCISPFGAAAGKMSPAEAFQQMTMKMNEREFFGGSIDKEIQRIMASP